MPAMMSVERSIALILLLLTVCRFIYSRYMNPQKSVHLPPGPTGIPILGNVHQIPLEHQEYTFAKWGRKYGDVVYVRLFSKPALILNSLRASQDLLDKKAFAYSDKAHFILLLDLFQFRPCIGFMPFSEQWRRHRKWFQGALETKSMLEGYRVLQRREARRLLSELIQAPAQYSLHIKRFTGSLMLEIAYGHTVSTVDDEFIVLADKAMAEMFEAGSLVASLVDFFPFLQHLPKWLPDGGFMKRVLKVRSMVRQMMDIPFEWVQQAVAGGSAKPSFTTFMMDEVSKDGHLSATDEYELKGAASSMYAAGSDTTMTVLTTFVLAMVLHPEVYKKAQAEIDRVVGDTRLPDYGDRDSLPYLECILKEVYRWNPPVALDPRRLMEDDTYRGYHIPVGSIVIPNLWSIGRDPEVYSEPDVFRPERFEDMDVQTASDKDPRKFVFGFGRRICPGRYFVDGSVYIAIANIVATMDIRKARDAAGQEITPSAEFRSGVVSHPKSFTCDISPRSARIADTVARLSMDVAA